MPNGREGLIILPSTAAGGNAARRGRTVGRVQSSGVGGVFLVWQCQVDDSPVRDSEKGDAPH